MTLFDVLPAALTETEAREQIQRIKGHWQAFWFELKEFHDRQGWLALGYSGFEACVEGELGITRQRAYQLIDAAKVRTELYECQHVLTLDSATEGQLRELKTLPAPVRIEVAQSIDFAQTPVRKLREIVKQAKEAIEIKRQERKASEPPKPEPPAVLPSTVTIDTADAAHLPLADESVDLICTSPPYGLSKEYGTADDAADWPSQMGAWLREMYRVAKQGGRLALNIPFDTTLGGHRPTYPQAEMAAEAAGWQYRFGIIWLEPNQNDTTARGSFASANSPHIIARAEIVLVCHKGEWNRGRPSERTMDNQECVDWSAGVWEIPGESRAWEGHPAPFPEELPRRLIKLLSFPGDTILDPFVGSGTTAVIAYRLGRKCFGYDFNPEFVNSARRRLAACETLNERD